MGEAICQLPTPAFAGYWHPITEASLFTPSSMSLKIACMSHVHLFSLYCSVAGTSRCTLLPSLPTTSFTGARYKASHHESSISHSFPSSTFICILGVAGTCFFIHLVYQFHHKHCKSRHEPIEFRATSEQCWRVKTTVFVVGLLTCIIRIRFVYSRRGGQLGSPGFNVADDFRCVRSSAGSAVSHVALSQDWLVVQWK